MGPKVLHSIERVHGREGISEITPHQTTNATFLSRLPGTARYCFDDHFTISLDSVGLQDSPVYVFVRTMGDPGGNGRIIFRLRYWVDGHFTISLDPVGLQDSPVYVLTWATDDPGVTEG